MIQPSKISNTTDKRMDKALLIAGIGAALVVVALLWHSRKNRSAETPFTGNVDASSEPAGNPTPLATTLTSSGEWETEVRMLIDYGNKIEAVRIVRERLSLGLKDAKELVDAMEHGAPIPSESDTAAPAADHEIDGEARKLLAEGRLITAIKLVREQKGLDLKQAKAYVESL